MSRHISFKQMTYSFVLEEDAMASPLCSVTRIALRSERMVRLNRSGNLTEKWFVNIFSLSFNCPFQI